MIASAIVGSPMKACHSATGICEVILHPYAGRREGRTWMVELYLPFLQTYEVITEQDFIALPRASDPDVRARAGQRGHS